jgi:hypothetical protein
MSHCLKINTCSKTLRKSKESLMRNNVSYKSKKRRSREKLMVINLDQALKRQLRVDIKIDSALSKCKIHPCILSSQRIECLTPNLLTQWQTSKQVVLLRSLLSCLRELIIVNIKNMFSIAQFSSISIYNKIWRMLLKTNKKRKLLVNLTLES